TTDSRPRQPGFWPRDLLTADLPEARLWTYGYDGDAIEARPGTNKKNNKNSLSKHGQDLATTLRREMVDEPIIFVAHSLGGLVVKDVGILAPSSRQTLTCSGPLPVRCLTATNNGDHFPRHATPGPLSSRVDEDCGEHWSSHAPKSDRSVRRDGSAGCPGG
ncbi:hypothetical protein B0T11DRAFT_282853, partial [Plectosphaerella cucumerina]